MRNKIVSYFESLIHFMLLLSVCSLDAYLPLPPNIPMYIVKNIENPDFCIHDGQVVSYDDILQLLAEIEENDLENRCTSDELFKINQFVAHLARKGFLSGEEELKAELEKDIQTLLAPRSSWQNGLHSLHLTEKDFALNDYFPSMAYAGAHKNWFSKQWDNTKKFVKKHKTAIIVGTILVVGTTLAIVYLTGSGIAAGAAAGIAALNEIDEFGHSPHVCFQEYPEYLIEDPSLDTDYFQTEYPSLQSVIDEHVLSFKEIVVEDQLLPTHIEQPFSNRSLIERTKELGAYLAHETVEGISQIAGFVPQVLNDLNNLGSQLGFSGVPQGCLNHGNPLESYQNFVASTHKKIDQFCSTNLSDKYISKLDRNESAFNFTLGIVPPPETLVPTIGRIPPTQTSSTWGWKVGQPIRNRTTFGRIPKWDTVRARYWKNEAHINSSEYRPKQLERMKKGLAPQRFNDNTGTMESMELHHMPPQREGGLFDFVKVWPDEHAELDKCRYPRKK